MSPLKELQTSFAGLGLNVNDRNSDVCSGETLASKKTASKKTASEKTASEKTASEAIASNGRLARPVPAIPPTSKRSTPSSRQDLFHRLGLETARRQSVGLPSIRINPGELSGRPAQLSPQPGPQHSPQPDPEATSPSISQQYQQTQSCGGIVSKPYDKDTQALRDKLIQLANIPKSVYPRTYPDLAVCDTLKGSRNRESKQFKNIFDYIMSRYDLLSNSYFKNHLVSKNLPEELFKPGNTLCNIPVTILEFVVHFLFPEDHILKNISFSGKHGYLLSYSDDEILHVYQPVRTEITRGIEGAKPVEVKYTANERPIIQQQATRGCAYAAAVMLMYQHNKRSFSVNTLISTNLGDSLISQALSSAGLFPFKTRFANLEELALAVNRDGSAIVSVSFATGAHFVIVDAVTDTSVLIRDPYHGWEVDIRREAFEKSWEKDAIQVK
ncbi:cysteine peptidase family C39 domain-containing protein [Endozoicomonas sp. SESOKO1]|uniref:cysteine peptidase family C39 domain-containing protein n=1 Tax=Endozoicomonas sp. SESOKO1 TaxID=2828742 RepID=UPI002148464B|nr:cysteine peptidase family C39 domain-containing protein [Endozoicomonas sp. SESOKO1]